MAICCYTVDYVTHRNSGSKIVTKNMLSNQNHINKNLRQGILLFVNKLRSSVNSKFADIILFNVFLWRNPYEFFKGFAEMINV